MQFTKRLRLALTATALMTGTGFAQPAQPVTATVTIAVDQPGAVIRPEIFGQFAEHVGTGIYGGIWVGKNAKIPNTNGYRNDVVAALKDLHVPLVRWPGGCFADEYHWRDGVGLTWYDPEPGRNPGFIWQHNTMRDAVVAAVTLNFFETHADRVRMANIAQMVNVLQAMIMTEGPKMLLTPTYHVFHMYVPFQGATALPTTVDAPRYAHDNTSVPTVSAQAAKRSDGSLAYALVNLDPNRPVTVTTRIRGGAIKSVSGRILSASAMDARNTFDNPRAVKPENFDGATLTGDQIYTILPPKSVVVLTLK